MWRCGDVVEEYFHCVFLSVLWYNAVVCDWCVSRGRWVVGEARGGCVSRGRWAVGEARGGCVSRGRWAVGEVRGG